MASPDVPTDQRDHRGAGIRVLFAQPLLPHYRYDVFKALECDERLIVDFAADKHYGHSDIPAIPFALFASVRRLHNIQIRRFLWQTGLISPVIRRRYDVLVYVGDASYLSTWLSASLARLFKIPVLFWTIGWHKPESGIRRMFRMTFYQLANHLLVYGDVGREIGVMLGYPSRRMTVIHNSSSEPIPGGAPPGRTLPEFIALLPGSGRPVVTAVIRLNQVKRLDLIIEAVSLLPPGESKPIVLLVGEGPERESLTRLAQSLGVELVVPGQTYDADELAAVYACTTVTVVPSVAGLTVLQSLKYGCPVITHDNAYEQAPEAEAIVRGITGDLYHYGEVADLARKIENWITIQSSRPKETAEACRTVVREVWSASSQATVISDQIETAYRRTKTNSRDFGTE